MKEVKHHTEFDGEVQLVVVHHQCDWCGKITDHYCTEATKCRATGHIKVPDLVNEDSGENS